MNKKQNPWLEKLSEPLTPDQRSAILRQAHPYLSRYRSSVFEGWRIFVLSSATAAALLLLLTHTFPQTELPWLEIPEVAVLSVEPELLEEVEIFEDLEILEDQEFLASNHLLEE